MMIRLHQEGYSPKRNITLQTHLNNSSNPSRCLTRTVLFPYNNLLFFSGFSGIVKIFRFLMHQQDAYRLTALRLYFDTSRSLWCCAGKRFITPHHGDALAPPLASLKGAVHPLRQSSDSTSVEY